MWEEEFIERCFQEMLEEEEEHEWFIPARDLPQTMDQIQDQFNDLVISDGSSLEDLVVKKKKVISHLFRPYLIFPISGKSSYTLFKKSSTSLPL